MKKILVFSNREQIGDGIIKLPFLYEIKRRFPKHKLIWATNSGTTVYNGSIRRIASQYIDTIYEKVPLSSFLFRKKSNQYNLNEFFDIIIDTQKAVIRSLALKRLRSKIFISSAANWLLSDIKPINRNYNNIRYYLDDLYFMLDLISFKKSEYNFTIKYPIDLTEKIKKIFNTNNKYIGFAPGSATKERIWDLKNFITVANYYSKLNYIPVFFLGPQEKNFKEMIVKNVKNVLFPEDTISDFNGPEVVMSASHYLQCSLVNDSGTSHMLSIGSKAIVKIIGPTNIKFTPKSERVYIIDSKKYGGSDINLVPVKDVIDLIKRVL